MNRLFDRWAGLAVSFAALAAILWFTPALWLRLDGWVQNQRDRVWEQVETVLGQKVVYDRIAPNVLSALDFQNVRLVADNGETLFQAASVRLSWDWELLFQGRFGEALRRVQVINATLSLDSRRDQALLDRWAGFFRPSTAEGGTSFSFQLEGFNVTARWTDGNHSLTLDRGFAVLSPQGREWGLRYRGALAWEERLSSRYARLTVRGELRSDASFRNFSLRTEASAVRTTWFDLEPITLQVTVDPNLLTVAKVADRTPFDLQLAWDRVADQWIFKGAAEEFRPSQLVRIKGEKAWIGLANGTLTGKFSYQLGGDFSFSGRASWPAGAVPAPLDREPLAISGAASSQGKIVFFQGFRLETPQVAAGFTGTIDGEFLPDGDLSLDRWKVPQIGEARGRVHLTREGRLVSFTGEDWIWNTLGTRSPTGWVEKTEVGWAFSVQGPLDRTDAASFSASGSYRSHPAQVDTEIEVIALPLALLRDEARGLLPGFDLSPDLWALETTIGARIEWGAGATPAVSVTSFAFHDPLVADRSASGTASWRGRHLDLALNPASWDAVRIGGTLSADLEEDGVLAGRLKGWLWNHPFDISGRWVPSDRTLAFSGAPGVSGVVHQNDTGAWAAYLTLEPQELVPGWTVGFLGNATLEGEHWTLDVEKLTLAGRYPWNQEAFSVTTKATANPDFVRLDDTVVNDSHGTWTGSALSSWSFGFTIPWAGRLALTTPTGRESLTLDWVGSAVDRWHLNVKASGIDVSRVGAPFLAGVVGRASVSGTADWTGADGTWACQAALSEARFGDSPLGFRASFSGTTRKLSVNALNLSVSPLRIVDGSGDLDLDARTWKASLGVGLRVGAGDWESRWATQGGWTAEEPLRISVSLATKGNSWSQRSFPDWGLVGSWSQASWRAAMSDGGLVAEGGEDGRFTVRAQSPFPLVGEAVGSWLKGEFKLAVQGFRADLSLIKDLVNSSLFSINTGVAQGNFSVGGSLADPEVNGLLEVKNLSVSSSFLRQPVGPVDVPLVLEGHTVRIDPVNIGPGSQTWMVSGAARLDHLLPEEYQFSLQTDALSVIPVSYQYTGISALGGASGMFVVKGTPLAVTLGGRLILQDTVITLKPTPETASGEPLGFNVDLTLVTGRKVEFLWPNESLPLLRAVTAAGQTLVIKANDVASTWSVTGKMGLRTGEINYLNRTFVLKEGQLSFQEDQAGFDPRISVRAEWKIREAAGPVIINLRADGTLTRFSPRFDAVPYKSPDELQQLVGTTLALPTDYTRTTNIETALSVASDVGTSLLLTPFEETIKRNFLLDLFTVKTEILKKTFLNRNGTPKASDYLDNTRLFFGKYIGDDLFLQGTLAFRQDGSIATQVPSKMVVEPEFQMEFQTPFFLLNWTLLPQHPETLFVTDNTVTFRWNWSY